MKTIAAVCVRMGSLRLPGKALRVVAGKPLLAHLIDRLRLTARLDGIVVATSGRSENDRLVQFCASQSIPCFRGDEDDVLGRLLAALHSQNADVGVNIFGDGPIIDPAIIDRMVDEYARADGQFDFVSNDLTTTWPSGMEVEVFSVQSLADAALKCRDSAVREHGTLFIRQNPELYRLRNIEAPADLRRSGLSLEVDVAEDIPVIEALLKKFSNRPNASLSDYIKYLDAHPGLADASRNVPRRWKQFRSDGAT